MAGTDVREFNRFVSLMPDDLWLIPIRREGKAPDIKKGTSWKDEGNRATLEATRWRIENGFNGGVAARGDVAIMDVDQPEKAQDYISDDLLNSTLVVETRSGGLHLHFLNGGVDNADITDGDGKEIIELRAMWRYVLIPGSYVPSEKGDGVYRVINARRPMEIKPFDLPEELRATERSYESMGTPDFEGKWLSLPCVKRIYLSENLPREGRRRIGGKVLSMAWYLNGKAEKDFIEFIKPFTERNRHGHNHRPGHYSWIRTIKSKNMEWNCAEIRKWLEKIGPLPCGRCPIEREKFEVGEKIGGSLKRPGSISGEV